MFFPFISHFTSPGSVCGGWGEGQPRCDLGQVSEGPVWNKLFLGTSWSTQPQSSVVAPPVGHSSSWCAQGTENSKEELLWFIKCSCITVSNELPVRHSASFELMGTLITSRCKCSCVVKTWRCHTAFWTRSGVLQQSSSFSSPLPPPGWHLFCSIRARQLETLCTVSICITPSQTCKEKWCSWGQTSDNWDSWMTNTLILAPMMCI